MKILIKNKQMLWITSLKEQFPCTTSILSLRASINSQLFQILKPQVKISHSENNKIWSIKTPIHWKSKQKNDQTLRISNLKAQFHFSSSKRDKQSSFRDFHVFFLIFPYFWWNIEYKTKLSDFCNILYRVRAC